MSVFSVGKAPAAILAVTLIAGAYLAANPVRKPPATLRLWTSAGPHYDAYKKAVASFEKAEGVTVDLELVSNDAVSTKLRAAFWSGLDVPDLAEVEINSAGTFFRGPLEDVGFVDETDWLHRSGWYDRLVHARFAPYMKRGRIFGLPHDVHPVMIAYRRDVFEREGIDPASIRTWDDFAAVGRRVTKDLDGDGLPDQYMIKLEDNWSGDVEMFLFQRGGGYFDAEGRLTLDSPVALDTLKQYVPLVAGPGRIANNLPLGQIPKAMEDGYFLCVLCPDWFSKFLENHMPGLSGKMALMPLPAAVPGGRRTSTCGGTMLGITKSCRRLDLARKLAVYLYYDAAERAEHYPDTNILPPLREAWKDPMFNQPRAYWSGQAIGRLYASLADDTPAPYSSPFTWTAKGKLAEVVTKCVAYYRDHGPTGFDAFAESSLQEAAKEVRELMKREPF